jgi:hypothetical protein
VPRFSSIFSQLLQLFPRIVFDQAVKKRLSDYSAKGFASWGQFVAMLFCQFGRAPQFPGDIRVSRSVLRAQDTLLLTLFGSMDPPACWHMLDFTCPGGYFPMISTPCVAIMLLPEKQITIFNWTSVTMMGDASMLPHNQGSLPGLQRLDLKGKK